MRNVPRQQFGNLLELLPMDILQFMEMVLMMPHDSTVMRKECPKPLDS